VRTSRQTLVKQTGGMSPPDSAGASSQSLGQLRLLAALCLVPQVAVLARGASVPHGGAELGPLHLAPRKAHHQCCGSHGHLPLSAVFVAG
jgi:hypothetical protein